MRPGVWHSYDECRHLALYNCCFSSELLRRELAWTREDPMLGYLLWDGPFSDTSGGMLTVHLEPETLAECRAQLTGLEALWRLPVSEYHGDIIGQLALLLSTLARAVTRVHGLPRDEVEMPRPAVDQAIRLLETRLADHWTVTRLADELFLAPCYVLACSRPPPGCRRWPTWPVCALSTPQICCCIRMSQSLHRPRGRVARSELLCPPLPDALRPQRPPRTGPVSRCARSEIAPCRWPAPPRPPSAPPAAMT